MLSMKDAINNASKRFTTQHNNFPANILVSLLLTLRKKNADL